MASPACLPSAHATPCTARADWPDRAAHRRAARPLGGSCCPAGPWDGRQPTQLPVGAGAWRRRSLLAQAACSYTRAATQLFSSCTWQAPPAPLHQPDPVHTAAAPICAQHAPLDPLRRPALRRGTTPLHFAAAAHKNPRAICELLLDRGADTGISDMSGRLPYEMASDDAIRALLDGPDPRLFEFAERGNLEGLRALFAEVRVGSKCLFGLGVVKQVEAPRTRPPPLLPPPPTHCPCCVACTEHLRKLPTAHPNQPLPPPPPPPLPPLICPPTPTTHPIGP